MFVFFVHEIELLQLDAVTREYGVGPVNPADIDNGKMTLSSHTQVPLHCTLSSVVAQYTKTCEMRSPLDQQKVSVVLRCPCMRRFTFRCIINVDFLFFL
jgi:hypothetical protein